MSHLERRKTFPRADTKKLKKSQAYLNGGANEHVHCILLYAYILDLDKENVPKLPCVPRAPSTRSGEETAHSSALASVNSTPFSTVESGSSLGIDH